MNIKIQFIIILIGAMIQQQIGLDHIKNQH